MALVHLVESDARRTTLVRKGDTVELRLAEIPTTGYRWRWRLPNGLRLIADEHVRPEPGLPGAPGQPGQRRLAFDITDSGEHELTAELVRPWEDTPRRTLSFVLQARVT
ncbi:putative secreted protein [Herbihabitans rhizosphaerae]|uniref:Putative secreted protein n=1 Tax=Herbihabitans rhizosphaerae TaxID=1872711 RepID=A0A4Q7KZF0_9PSEU|nr:protease inhibitor I42 family protein [Herbihabitans rhizosphaerae]RZS41082.1 putative secreted protein [Herbihabitans rhizosphaerae]